MQLSPARALQLDDVQPEVPRRGTAAVERTEWLCPPLAQGDRDQIAVDRMIGLIAVSGDR